MLGLGQRISRRDRRSAWTPASLGAYLLWEIDPERSPLITTVSGRIQSVQDSSLTGAHAVAPSAGARPLEILASYNNGNVRKALRFDGATVCLNVGDASHSDALVTGAARLVVIERVQTASSINSYIVTSQQGTEVQTGAGLGVWTFTNARRAAAGKGTVNVSFRSGTISWTANQFHATTIRHESGTFGLWRNGAERSGGAVTSPAGGPATYPITLGASALGVSGAGTASGPLDIGYCALVSSSIPSDLWTRYSDWLFATVGLRP